jgi:hypothetical protein
MAIGIGGRVRRGVSVAVRSAASAQCSGAGWRVCRDADARGDGGAAGNGNEPAGNVRTRQPDLVSCCVRRSAGGRLLCCASGLLRPALHRCRCRHLLGARVGVGNPAKRRRECSRARRSYPQSLGRLPPECASLSAERTRHAAQAIAYKRAVVGGNCNACSGPFVPASDAVVPAHAGVSLRHAWGRHRRANRGFTQVHSNGPAPRSDPMAGLTQRGASRLIRGPKNRRQPLNSPGVS